MSDSVRWESKGGKLWLVVVHGGTKYRVPLDPESRYVDGTVLFGDAKRPPLVSGMMAWSEFEKVLDKVPGAHRELERFQAPAILAQGGSLDWTTPEEAYPGLPPIPG